MKDRVKYSWDKVLVTFLVIFQIESFESIYMFLLQELSPMIVKLVVVTPF